MTDDDKLALVGNKEQHAWQELITATPNTSVLANQLDIIERCQRIRANLQEQSVYDEIRTPRNFQDGECDVWGFELGSASRGDYARVSDGRNNMKASILGEVEPSEGFRGEMALEIAFGRAEVEEARRNLEV